MRHSDIFDSVVAEGLANGAAVRFRAEGISMYPTIRDGETITVVSVSAHDVVRGDILLCRHGARLLAHRVVAVTTAAGLRTFDLRGDAKSACDAPVGAPALVARVIEVRRGRRCVQLCGRAARARRAMRLAASRGRTFILSTPRVLRTLIGQAAAPIAAAARR